MGWSVKKDKTTAETNSERSGQTPRAPDTMLRRLDFLKQKVRGHKRCLRARRMLLILGRCAYTNRR